MNRFWYRSVLAGAILSLSLGGATCEPPPVLPPLVDLEAPQALALVCLHRVDVGSDTGAICPEDFDANGEPLSNAVQVETVPLESCNVLGQFEEVDLEENPTRTVLPDSFLFLLTSNLNRGDVTVTSVLRDNVSANFVVIDSDRSLPGVNFIPVGDFPTAIQVDSGEKQFVTANAGSNSISIFENTDLLPCNSNTQKSTIFDLGGSPRDLVLDANGVAYITLPDSAELIAVDTRQDPPAILGRADLTVGASGLVRPSRVVLSEPRRVAFVSNVAGNEVVEVNIDSLVQGISEVSFINVNSKTGAIAYLEPRLLEFEGTIPEDAEAPEEGIDIPETLYVASLDFIGQVLVIDIDDKTLIDPFADAPSANEALLNAEKPGPGIRVGFSQGNPSPITDIEFFTVPLLPIFSSGDEVIQNEERPDILEGAFALVMTNDTRSFVVNVAPVDPNRQCCGVDGDPAICQNPQETEADGSCPEGVFLPDQRAHTVRNIFFDDEPGIGVNPALLSDTLPVSTENASVVQRFPAIGTSDGCLGGEADCVFDNNDAAIETPVLRDGVFQETWIMVFEGVIPNSIRNGGLIVGNTIEDNANFCARGIQPGDILQILSQQKIADDLPVECENLTPPPGVNAQGAFDPNGAVSDNQAGSTVTAELIVSAVEKERVFFQPRPGVENPPADLAACYNSTIEYRFRVGDSDFIETGGEFEGEFLVSVSGGQEEHLFLHRQVALADGTCAIDQTKSALFNSRAKPGTIFTNSVFRLELTDPEPPSLNGVQASFRETAWVFQLGGGFTPWTLLSDPFSNSTELTIPGDVIITPDGVNGFVSDLNLDLIYITNLPNKARLGVVIGR